MAKPASVSQNRKQLREFPTCRLAMCRQLKLNLVNWRLATGKATITNTQTEQCPPYGRSLRKGRWGVYKKNEAAKCIFTIFTPIAIKAVSEILKCSHLWAPRTRTLWFSQHASTSASFPARHCRQAPCCGRFDSVPGFHFWWRFLAGMRLTFLGNVSRQSTSRANVPVAIWLPSTEHWLRTFWLGLLGLAIKIEILHRLNIVNSSPRHRLSGTTHRSLYF